MDIPSTSPRSRRPCTNGSAGLALANAVIRGRRREVLLHVTLVPLDEAATGPYLVAPLVGQKVKFYTGGAPQLEVTPSTLDIYVDQGDEDAVRDQRTPFSRPANCRLRGDRLLGIAIRRSAVHRAARPTWWTGWTRRWPPGRSDAEHADRCRRNPRHRGRPA